MCILAQYTIYVGLSSADRCSCSYIHCASERQTFLSQYNVEGLLVTELLFYHKGIQGGNLGQEEEWTTLQSPSHTRGTTSTLYYGSELPSLFLPSLFLPSLFLPLPSLPPLPPPPPYSLLLPLPLFLLPNTKVYSNTSYCTAHSLLQSLEGRLTQKHNGIGGWMSRTHLPGLSVVVNHHILIEFVSIKRIVVHGTKPGGREHTPVA